MWYNSYPAGLHYAQTAPNHIRIELITHASAERLYQILLTSGNQPQWANGFRRVVWHTASPYDTGSVRDVHLAWISVRERFLALEPARRFAFSSDALTLPIVRQMVEDIRFEPIDERSATLIWNVYYEPVGWLKPINSWLRIRIFQPMFHDFVHGLARYAAAVPKPSERFGTPVD